MASRSTPSNASCTSRLIFSVIRKDPVAEAAAPAKGTRPEGAQTEADAARKVREMFTEIAPRYDFLNHFLSLQLDRLWRARAARHLRPISHPPAASLHHLCSRSSDLPS